MGSDGNSETNGERIFKSGPKIDLDFSAEVGGRDDVKGPIQGGCDPRLSLGRRGLSRAGPKIDLDFSAEVGGGRDDVKGPMQGSCDPGLSLGRKGFSRAVLKLTWIFQQK